MKAILPLIVLALSLGACAPKARCDQTPAEVEKAIKDRMLRSAGNNPEKRKNVERLSFENNPPRLTTITGSQELYWVSNFILPNDSGSKDDYVVIMHCDGAIEISIDPGGG